MVKYKPQFILVCCLLAFMTVRLLRADGAPAQDIVNLQQRAKQAYYTILPQSIRRVNGFEQFLTIVEDPSQEEVSALPPGCRLILAQRTQQGDISVIWQYRLSTTQTAPTAVWYNGKSKAKNNIFVYFYDGTCSTFHIEGNLPPVLINNFRVKSANATMVLGRNQFFVAPSASGKSTIFFSNYGLLALGLDSGKTQLVYQAPKLYDNFTQYLAAEDLDGGWSYRDCG